ncbi:hypothetical protein HPB50_024244 [Hyalomma asiaticum]|uniref:Uncharacterized protein n=1 Tax=Hyalomma asiaticum TaxID=266040 RepID=A0ACB7TQL4_HYAAI|nr:hypothetical protein HPB50_024244 [Hyalomma asiaticum]
MLKSAALTNLSQQLNGDNPPRSEIRLYITMTRMSCHTEHDFGNFMKYGQTVDRSIIERINDLVQEGITSMHEVKTCLRYYVQDVLFSGKEKPDPDCRAFYPTSKDIRNHIQESLRQGRCSNLDQENVAVLVSSLEGEEPTSKVLFRPYCYTSEAKTTIPEADDDQINVEENLAKQCDKTLLFCYQSRFMAQLLKQYGNNVTCFDATNKTTDYSLPLFFLVVKTPTNYMVAGVFVVQYETTACISEALNVFKSWNPEYLPKYFMVDFCQAEISSISEVFPQSEVMLCNFHREQAWERWVKRKENDVPPDQKDALLGLFRKIANSSSREEFDEAYKCLKNSVFWRNDKVASYFETQWMPAAKMWVQYHRMKFGVVVTTNNGTETQNRILKEHYLRWSHGRRSLSSLITVAVKKFLPERQSVFIQQNVESSTPSCETKACTEECSLRHGYPINFTVVGTCENDTCRCTFYSYCEEKACADVCLKDYGHKKNMTSFCKGRMCYCYWQKQCVQPECVPLCEERYPDKEMIDVFCKKDVCVCKWREERNDNVMLGFPTTPHSAVVVPPRTDRKGERSPAERSSHCADQWDPARFHLNPRLPKGRL